MLSLTRVVAISGGAKPPCANAAPGHTANAASPAAQKVLLDVILEFSPGGVAPCPAHIIGVGAAGRSRTSKRGGRSRLSRSPREAILVVACRLAVRDVGVESRIEVALGTPIRVVIAQCRRCRSRIGV